MIYNIKQTSQAGQVLLQSEATHGGISAQVSLQMPEDKAKQILAAFDVVEKIAKLTNDDIALIVALNTEKTLKKLRDDCKEIITNNNFR